MADVQSHIDAQLTVATEVETRVKTVRAEAAAKIFSYWTLKKSSMAARKRAPPSPNDDAGDGAVALETLDGARLTKLKGSYCQPEVQKAAARCRQLYTALHRSDSLARSLTFLLASVFVKSALDQEFLLSKLKAVQEMRRELITFVFSSFGEGSAGITRGVSDDLRLRVERLGQRAGAEQTLLDEWLAKTDAEMSLVEQKKARFRKMEKWTTVFAANRAARKRKSLLQMLKAQKK